MEEFPTLETSAALFLLYRWHKGLGAFKLTSQKPQAAHAPSQAQGKQRS